MLKELLKKEIISMLADYIAAYTKGWVVKRDTDASPRRIADEDVDFLTRLVTGQAGLAMDDALQNMRMTLDGWLTQRARGERPSGFDTVDFEALLAFLPSLQSSDDTGSPTISPGAENVSNVLPEMVHEPVAAPVDHEAAAEGREGQGMREIPIPTRRLPRQEPAHDLFSNLEFSRFHVEHGV